MKSSLDEVSLAVTESLPSDETVNARIMLPSPKSRAFFEAHAESGAKLYPILRIPLDGSNGQRHPLLLKAGSTARRFAAAPRDAPWGHEEGVNSRAAERHDAPAAQNRA
jgi:hypothetical protein